MTREFRTDHKKVCDGVAADSGASSTISKVREDFEFLEATPSVQIKAAGGALGCVGYRGKLRPNLLGIRHAVYYPLFSVDRLISIKDIQEIGWSVLCAAKGRGPSFAYREGGGRLPIYRTTSDLPKIPVFGDLDEEEDEMELADEITAHLIENGEDPSSIFYVSALLEHRRSMHTTRLPKKVICPECLAGKLKRKPNAHRKKRSLRHVDGTPLRSMVMDFYGSIHPRSIRNCHLVLRASTLVLFKLQKSQNRIL